MPDSTPSITTTAPSRPAGWAPLSIAMRHRLAWPLVTLLLLLAVNTGFNANFLHLEWRDGHLYGSLIDILNRAAPLVLVALGMTLVIATRGIDISVGAVVAIAAALAAWMIGGSLVGNGAHSEPLSDAGWRSWARWASRWCAACGTACWWRKVGHAADHRDADPDGGRPRHRAAHHRRADHHHLLRAVLLPRQRLPVRAAVLAVHRGGWCSPRCTSRSRAGARAVHPGGGHQPDGGARGRRAGPAADRRRLCVLRPLRRASPAC